MPRPTHDVAQPPVDPQFPLGATSDDAVMYQQLVHSPVGDPGDIVGRLGQQFQLPRADPDSQMSKRPGENLGTS